MQVSADCNKQATGSDDVVCYNVRCGGATDVSEHDKVVAGALAGKNEILGVGAGAEVENAFPGARLVSGKSERCDEGDTVVGVCDCATKVEEAAGK